MHKLVKPALVLGFVGAIALAAATPSEARSGRNAAAIGAGIAGFAVGAAIASSANSYYYGAPYGYYEPAYGYPAYGYYSEPAYGYYAADSYAYAPGPTRYYQGDPSSYYAPNYAYPTRRWSPRGPNYEDHLTGSGSGAIR